MTEKSQIEKERSRVLQLYGAFTAALVLSLLPFISAAIVSLVLFIGLLIATGIVRRRAAPDSLAENHAIYLIRTIWVGGLVALISLALGSAYMLSMIDNTALQPCIESFMQNPGNDLMAMKLLFEPCFDSYMSGNFLTFAISGVLAAGPILLYFAVRLVRGLMRAKDGYRLANPRMWF